MSLLSLWIDFKFKSFLKDTALKWRSTWPYYSMPSDSELPNPKQNPKYRRSGNYLDALNEPNCLRSHKATPGSRSAAINKSKQTVLFAFLVPFLQFYNLFGSPECESLSDSLWYSKNIPIQLPRIGGSLWCKREREGERDTEKDTEKDAV